MRVRINDIEHFLKTVEKSKVEVVYVDDHQGWWYPIYHIWIIDNTDCVEVKIKNLDTLLFALTEINDMKKEVRVVRWKNSRRY